MRKTISVTQKHINKGRREEPSACPVYFALKDNGIDVSTVGWYTVELLPNNFNNRSTKNYLSLPRSASRFIEKFDTNGRKAVKPFRFYINVDEN